MPARKVDLPGAMPPELAAGLARIRAELEVPDAFAPAVLAAAEAGVAAARLPELDRTDLELVTIDPPGARDLDQALHIARAGNGFVVSYAIADVAAFVSPGDAVDREAHRRGLTLYAPDRRTPLHPPVLSEGAASLLPGEVRPALLWTLRLDAGGEMTDADVVRARVRSRQQLDYGQAQAEIDGGSAREALALLAVVGRSLESRERERGGVSLPLPEQEIVPADDGWLLEFRAPRPVEGWNAQISLLTGMAAADIMLYGQVGVLRSMPPADPGSLRRLRVTARALGIAWPAELDYPDFVRSLDPTAPAHAAALSACTTLFRGAGYLAFNGEIPAEAEHSALATDYAHCTAPLRRLVDRYVGEVCLALCAGTAVPSWVVEALPGLPQEMATADRRAKKYERSILDLVEAVLLSARVGEVFPATVVEVDDDRRHGTVVLTDPAVEAKVTGEALPLGRGIQVRLVTADLERGAVVFERAG
jgi:exoribonuclease R